MKNDTKEIKLCFSRKLRRTGVKTVDFFRTKGKQNMIIFLSLVVLVIFFWALNPNFLDKYNIVSIAQTFAPYAILGLGVTFVIATGGIDLSIGTVCIASAVLAGKLYMSGMPLALTIPVMILLGTAFGALNGFLVAKMKLPAFIATLGTMMLSQGLSAILVKVPNVFFPSGTWFNSMFSNLNGFPISLIWVIAIMLVCMYFMYKNKIGRYILSIGSNEEATRLSGINTDKYKWIAYIISGMFAGIAAIFWAASFPTVAAATGNGFELNAIAGVYIGGTSANGGFASITGSFIGNLMLVVIRSGLNFVLARFNLNINATYATYVLTGIIVVVSVLIDVIKTKKEQKVKVATPKQKLKKEYSENLEKLRCDLDIIISDKSNPDRENLINRKREEITDYKAQMTEQIKALSVK